MQGHGWLKLMLWRALVHSPPFLLSHFITTMSLLLLHGCSWHLRFFTAWTIEGAATGPFRSKQRSSSAKLFRPCRPSRLRSLAAPGWCGCLGMMSSQKDVHKMWTCVLSLKSSFRPFRAECRSCVSHLASTHLKQTS